MGNGFGPRVGEDISKVVSAFPRVSLDTNTCIYFLQRKDPWFGPSATLFARARQARLALEICSIVQMELLVRPLARGDLDEEQRVIDLTERTAGVGTTLMDRDVIFAAGRVRALTRLRAPDALVVGSAAVSSSNAIVGNDKGFEILNKFAGVRLTGAGRQPMMMPRYIHLDDYIDRPRTRRRSRKTNG